MSFVLSIQVTGNPSKVAASVSGLLTHPQVKDVAVLAGVETWQAHLDQHYVGRPNKLGGASTGYWTRVRNSVGGTPTASGATITASGPGLKMKFDGGTVTPGKGISSYTGKPTAFLSIPVHPSAHGKRPADFPRGSFFLVQLHGPASAAGLVLKSGRSKKRGTLMFVLSRSVNIKSDRAIAPRADEMIQNMQKRVAEFTASGEWKA